MSHLRRMLKGAIRGTLLGLAISTGLAVFLLLLDLPGTHPMDRWYLDVRASALVIGITLIGLIAGFASSVSEHGLSLLWSVSIVAIGCIVGAGCNLDMKMNWSLTAPLWGVFSGGIVVILLGLIPSNAVANTKLEGENTADKE